MSRRFRNLPSGQTGGTAHEPPTREIEIDRGIDAAGVIGDRSAAGLEFPQGDLRVLVAVAARSQRAVDEPQCLTRNEVGIHGRRRDAAGERGDRILHHLRIGGAVAGPAVVELAAEANHHS